MKWNIINDKQIICNKTKQATGKKTGKAWKTHVDTETHMLMLKYKFHINTKSEPIISHKDQKFIRKRTSKISVTFVLNWPSNDGYVGQR